MRPICRMNFICYNFKIMVDLISPHGGYRNLKSFQMAEIVFDLTFDFCKVYISDLKLRAQIEGAARGGKQNIAEGSSTSGSSKQSELRLIQVARASQEELLNDFLDFLRTRGLEKWGKDDSRTQEIRNLAYRSDKSNGTYKTYMTHPEIAANCLICLIHQTNYLLDQQMKVLEKDLIEQGDYKERYSHARKQKIVGDPEEEKKEYKEFLKEAGCKQLKNGQVVNIDDLRE